MNPPDTALTAALCAPDASVRLQAALSAGSSPRSALVELLVQRCAVEPDFYVRDMLTWALIRHPHEQVLPRLLGELGSVHAQARSQALHTLSKIQDASTWPAITPALLTDAQDEVARSAWRAAVILVPPAERLALATLLVTQLGRGDEGLHRSLSRALLALGAELVEPLLHGAMSDPHAAVRAHAAATVRLLRDPDSGFDAHLREARRAFVLGPQR